MKTTQISINDTTITGYEIDMPNAKLILAVAPKGYVMCGYLDIKSADKFNDTAAIVRGVKSIEDLLTKEVSEVSKQAAAAGIKTGMTGREAITCLI